jgi:hypothetical protein
MMLSEYIAKLQTLLDNEGDHPVVTYGYNAIIPASVPRTNNLLILTSRARNQRIWQSYDPPEHKGKKVIIV